MKEMRNKITRNSGRREMNGAKREKGRNKSG